MQLITIDFSIIFHRNFVVKAKILLRGMTLLSAFVYTNVFGFVCVRGEWCR